MKKYCPVCGKETDTEVIEKKENLTVKGYEITLKVKIRICKECREELIDEELDKKSLNAFYEEYKRTHNLLTANEIKKIREKWGVSQSQFSIILGMGEKTITRYENGSIQDETHDNLIRLANELNNFKLIWNLRKNIFDKKVNQKIESQIEKAETIFSVMVKPICGQEYSYRNYNFILNLSRSDTNGRTEQFA